MVLLQGKTFIRGIPFKKIVTIGEVDDSGKVCM